MHTHRTVFSSFSFTLWTETKIISFIFNVILVFCHYFDGYANNINKMCNDLLAPTPFPLPGSKGAWTGEALGVSIKGGNSIPGGRSLEREATLIIK